MGSRPRRPEADKIEWVPLASVPKLIESGQIWNAGTLVTLLRVLARGF